MFRRRKGTPRPEGPPPYVVPGTERPERQELPRPKGPWDAADVDIDDDPNTVMLEPGQSAELTWTFAQATGLEFACNIPGHYQAGMVGNVEVQP